MLIKLDSIGLKKISKSVESVLKGPRYFERGLQSTLHLLGYDSLGLMRLCQFWLGTLRYGQKSEKARLKSLYVLNNYRQMDFV